MFPNPDNFAPDLDWLLGSHQAPPEIMLEGLVQEYYPEVYALAVSMLDSRKAGRDLAAVIFTRAMIERHSFQTAVGSRIWLFRIALNAASAERKRLQVRRTLWSALPSRRPARFLGDSQPATSLDADLWLAVDGLDEPFRTLILMHHRHGWGEAELEKLLDILPGAVREALDKADAEIEAALTQPPPTDPPSKPAVAFHPDEQIRSSLHRRWPQREFTPAELDELTRRIGRRALHTSGQLRKAVSFIEVGVVLALIFLTAGFIWGADRLFPEVTPTPTPVLIQLDTQIGELRPAQRQPAIEFRDWDRNNTLPHVHPEAGDTWASLAQAMGVTEAELKAFNRIPDGTQPTARTRLLHPADWPDLKQRPGLVLPDIPSEPMQLEDALTGPPGYQTVWLDAVAVDYGPQAYSGQPRVSRAQAWLNADWALILSGWATDPLPNSVQLTLTPDGGELRTYAADPSARRLWFWGWEAVTPAGEHPPVERPEALRMLVDREGLTMATRLRSAGRELVAGVDALVLDRFDGNRQLERFWLDDRTGLILRRVIFNQSDPRTVRQKYEVRRLAYNANIPTELMTEKIPWRGGYADDPTGTPEKETRIVETAKPNPVELSEDAPPTGFDAASAILTFRFRLDYPGYGPSPMVGLYAGGYFLTHLALSNSWETACTRSPDGQWLAYSSHERWLPEEDVFRVNWTTLNAPSTRGSSLVSQADITEMAFSPDSRRLAYVIEPMEMSAGQLVVTDLDSGETTVLMTLWKAASLVWSPDGKSLGLIARLEKDNYDEHVIVLRSTGDEGYFEYSEPIDYGQKGERDWPMVEWGVEFPVERNGLGDCAAPPTTD